MKKPWLPHFISPWSASHWAFIKFPFKVVLRFLFSVSTGADFYAVLPCLFCAGRLVWGRALFCLWRILKDACPSLSACSPCFSFGPFGTERSSKWSDRGHLLPCLSECVAEKKPEHTKATELFGQKLLEAPGNFLLANMRPHLGVTGQKSSELP